MIVMGPPGVSGLAGLMGTLGLSPTSSPLVLKPPTTTTTIKPTLTQTIQPTVACVRAPCPTASLPVYKPTTSTTLPTSAPTPAPAPAPTAPAPTPTIFKPAVCTQPPKTVPPVGMVWGCTNWVSDPTYKPSVLTQQTSPPPVCVRAPCPTGSVQTAPSPTDVKVMTSSPAAVRAAPQTATLPNAIPVPGTTEAVPETAPTGPDYGKYAVWGGAAIGAILIGYGAIKFLAR